MNNVNVKVPQFKVFHRDEDEMEQESIMV